MASTNKTTNYGLSQWIDTDKPSFLQDLNSDFEKIDTGMYAAQQAANAAAGSIATIQAASQQALTTAKTAKTTAENAQGQAANAANVAAQANTTAGQALTTAQQYIINSAFVTTGGDPNCKVSIVFNDLFVAISGQIYATAQAEAGNVFQKVFGDVYPAQVPDFSDVYNVAIMGTDNSFKGTGTIRVSWTLASKTLAIDTVSGFTENCMTQMFTVIMGRNNIN